MDIEGFEYSAIQALTKEANCLIYAVLDGDTLKHFLSRERLKNILA